jgi:hypothetical protein
VTYNDLISELPTTLMAQNRTLLDPARLQQLVIDAEDEIIERIDHDAFRARIAGLSVSPTQPVIDLRGQPRRVFEVRAVQVPIGATVYPLERREIERLVALYVGAAPGTPRYYAEDDEPQMFRVFPVPDQTYALSVSANIEPERLSPAVQQSVLTRSYPRLMKMMLRKHGAHFMRNQVDEQRYGTLADAALMEANRQLARRRRDETGVISAPTSNNVG